MAAKGVRGEGYRNFFKYYLIEYIIIIFFKGSHAAAFGCGSVRGVPGIMERNGFHFCVRNISVIISLLYLL